MPDLASVRAGLRAIDQRIAAGQIGHAKPWGGARVGVVAEVPPEDGQPGFYPSPRYAVTPHVGAVSWMFNELWWQVFQPHVDFVDKFEFFGRLGTAVNRYHASIDGEGTARDAVGAVLHEAYAILDDMEAGQFAGPAVTSGNAIHDDAISEAERMSYVTTEELEGLHEEPGG